MCRFIYYRGPEISLSSLLTEPEHSLIHQSYGARERPEPLNGDGFGVAWYRADVRPEPVVFKEVNPAWSSINLVNLAPVAASDCILAHVRAASPGLAVSQLNCHPFARGKLSYMHNGQLASFRDTRRRLLATLSDSQFKQIESTGDSEVLLAIAMDHLEAAAASPSLEDMADALMNAINVVESAAEAIGSHQEAWLNLVLSDGQQAVITRYVTPGGGAAQSLYCHQGARYQCDDGVCRMLDADEVHAATIVSSEPLSSDKGWESVPQNTMLLIDGRGRVERRPIEAQRQI